MSSEAVQQCCVLLTRFLETAHDRQANHVPSVSLDHYGLCQFKLVIESISSKSLWKLRSKLAEQVGKRRNNFGFRIPLVASTHYQPLPQKKCYLVTRVPL